MTVRDGLSELFWTASGVMVDTVLIRFIFHITGNSVPVLP